MLTGKVLSETLILLRLSRLQQFGILETHGGGTEIAFPHYFVCSL